MQTIVHGDITAVRQNQIVGGANHREAGTGGRTLKHKPVGFILKQFQSITYIMIMLCHLTEIHAAHGVNVPIGVPIGSLHRATFAFPGCFVIDMVGSCCLAAAMAGTINLMLGTAVIISRQFVRFSSNDFPTFTYQIVGLVVNIL